MTDKAVSKWERELEIFDISTSNGLANILNINANNLVSSNVAYLKNVWAGELRLDIFETKISIITEVYGILSVYFYLFCTCWYPRSLYSSFRGR